MCSVIIKVMELTGREKVFLVVAAAAVIVTVVTVFIMVNNARKANVGNGSTSTSGAPVQPIAGAPPIVSASSLPTSAPVVTVSGAGAGKITPGIAVPIVGEKSRSFDVIVQNNAFMPSALTVHLGDSVNLEIGAIGAGYDFTQPDFGLHVVLPNGANKKIQFTATAAGKFVFYCSSCGGPAKGPVGYLVVESP
jgi:heme/copper-type cytochrome/quinol oxidase subunit 2